MARGLAFVQLLIICLGVFTLHLLGKLNHLEAHSGFVPELAYFLGRHGLWLIPIPILWAIVGNLLTTRGSQKAARVVGVIVTTLVFVVFAVPLVWRLS